MGKQASRRIRRWRKIAVGFLGLLAWYNDPKATSQTMRSQGGPTMVSMDDSDNVGDWRQRLNEFNTKGLSRTERLVYGLHHLEDLNMSEIGFVLDLPEHDVIELYRQTRRKIRQAMNDDLDIE
jgi:DNA-directed RNA polymerase specialized sigma24 family protein